MSLSSFCTTANADGLPFRLCSIRRGAYILAAVGICTQPWQILANAGIFLSVLGGFGKPYKLTYEYKAYIVTRNIAGTVLRHYVRVYFASA